MENIDTTQVERRVQTALATPSDLSQDGIAEISSALRQLLADVFALFLKTRGTSCPSKGSFSCQSALLWRS